MHPLNGALPGPYVPVRVTLGALVAHWYTYATSRCRTSQYRRTFVPLTVSRFFFSFIFSLWNDLADSVFDGVGLTGFNWTANAFFIGISCSIPTIVFYDFSLSFLSVYRLVLWGWGLRTDIWGVYHSLSSLHCRPLFNNNNNIVAVNGGLLPPCYSSRKRWIAVTLL